MRIITILCGVTLGLIWNSPAEIQEESYNYDESKVPPYTLPDPLLTSSGSRITHKETWRRLRRVEILKLFETHVYGRSPGRPRTTAHKVLVDPSALGGLATRKQVSIFFKNDKTGPSINLLIYLLNSEKEAVPAFLGLNFNANHSIHTDPGITLSDQWMRPSKEEGIVVDNRDIDPDFDDGFQNGVHPLFYEGTQSQLAPDQWGAIGAWAWGLSRALDYLEAEPMIARHFPDEAPTSLTFQSQNRCWLRVL